MRRMLVGVDEAGRGPLAGPVAVGAAAFSPDFDWSLLNGIRDSKRLSEAAREEWYARMLSWRRRGVMDFAVAYSSASSIDRWGITRAVMRAAARAIRATAPEPSRARILLDGSLYAPPEYAQKTIIGGDDSEPAISLASIAAKVRRDRLMRRLARAFPRYEFEVHKGYGTRKHREAVARYGLCAMHRRTFCQKLGSVVQRYTD